MPAQAQGGESYIELADFSPGIFSGYFSKTGQEVLETGTPIPVKDGALQELGTYGCCAGPNGGIIPLPRVRAYLQDVQFHDDMDDASVSLTDTSTFLLPWSPSWVTAQDIDPAPRRIPIVAAKVMPAFVGPARSGNEDIEATEPISHDPLVYWHDGPDSQGSVDIDLPDSDLVFDACGSDTNVVTAASTDLFPPDPHWGIGFWARSCVLSPTGDVTVLVEDGNGIPFMSLSVTSGGAQATVYNRNGLTKNFATDTPVVDQQEWVFYGARCTNTGFGDGIEVSVNGVVLDSDGSWSSADSCFGVSEWSWVYAHALCGDILQLTDVSVHVGADWEIFGIGVYPDPIDVTDFEDIYNAQGPAIADFVPGFVTPGTRPDLTSGDVSFPGLVAVTYDYYTDDNDAGAWSERMISRLYKPWLLNAQEGPNIATTFYDAFDDSLTPSAEQYIYGYAGYDFARSRHADVTVAGPPFLVILASPTYGSDTEKLLLMYPDPDSLNTDGVQTITADLLFGVLSHQGRVMYLAHSSEEGALLPFGDQGTMAGFERWGWTLSNDLETISNDLTVVYVPENPFGYGAWVSINASEALLIKQMNGGVDVRNDVDNPTVVRLPGIASTGQFFNKPINTPYGVVYGSNRGTWLWTGGDQSVPLSKQLSGHHLVASDESINDYAGMKGSFVHVEPFIFCPNNWVFDTRTEAWFRLRPHPDVEQNYPIGFAPPAIFYDVDTLGRIYAFPSYLELGTLDADGEPARGYNVFCQVYDPEFAESRWQARTQPLARTRGRELRFREILLSASGHGTIKMTLTGIDGTERDATFVIDSDAPRQYRANIALAAQDVVCTILSDSGDPDLPAPTYHRSSLRYSERQGIGTNA